MSEQVGNDVFQVAIKDEMKETGLRVFSLCQTVISWIWWNPKTLMSTLSCIASLDPRLFALVA